MNNNTNPIGDRSCLIGYTGFVGGNLTSQASFSVQFNSQSIGDMAGQCFDTVICAAAPGSMFEANKFPARDQKAIQALINHLSRVETQHFILISSIAVLENSADGSDETNSAFQNTLAYGRHRRVLEAFVEEQFKNSLVVRLPALFGYGLRKNFIFDLLNPVPSMLTEAKLENLITVLDKPLAIWVRELYTHDQSTGMFKVDRAALDADKRRDTLNNIVLRAGLSPIHLAPEPLKEARIYEHLTGCMMPDTGARLYHEDMQTCHAEFWGRTGRYISDSDSVLNRLTAFFDSERGVP